MICSIPFISKDYEKIKELKKYEIELNPNNIKKNNINILYEIDEKYTATGEYMIVFDEDILKAPVKILKVILKSNTEYINAMEAELEKLQEANIEIYS